MVKPRSSAFDTTARTKQTARKVFAPSPVPALAAQQAAQSLAERQTPVKVAEGEGEVEGEETEEIEGEEAEVEAEEGSEGEGSEEGEGEEEEEAEEEEEEEEVEEEGGMLGTFWSRDQRSPDTEVPGEERGRMAEEQTQQQVRPPHQTEERVRLPLPTQQPPPQQPLLQPSTTGLAATPSDGGESATVARLRKQLQQLREQNAELQAENDILLEKVEKGGQGGGMEAEGLRQQLTAALAEIQKVKEEGRRANDTAQTTILKTEEALMQTAGVLRLLQVVFRVGRTGMEGAEAVLGKMAADTELLKCVRPNVGDVLEGIPQSSAAILSAAEAAMRERDVFGLGGVGSAGGMGGMGGLEGMRLGGGLEGLGSGGLAGVGMPGVGGGLAAEEGVVGKGVGTEAGEKVEELATKKWVAERVLDVRETARFAVGLGFYVGGHLMDLKSKESGDRLLLSLGGGKDALAGLLQLQDLWKLRRGEEGWRPFVEADAAKQALDAAMEQLNELKELAPIKGKVRIKCSDVFYCYVLL